MSDSESKEILPQPAKRISYRRIRWRRALRDTKQIIKGDIRLEVAIAAATAVVGGILRYYTGEPKELNVLFVSFVVGMAVLGLTVFGYWLCYFFTAPSRMYWEDQERIAELESQLDRQLDIYVALYSVFITSPKGFHYLDINQDGLLIILRDIRFTNRSTTHRVSLELTLIVPLHPPVAGKDYLRVREERTLWEKLPPDLFCSPFSIGPGDTQAGNMCFPILPEAVHEYGGKDAMDPNHCRLEIVDLASKKKVVQDISRERWESRL